MAILRTIGQPLRLAHTIRHLGDVYNDDGNRRAAEPCYREALEIYRAHPDAPRLDLANAIRSLAVLTGESGADGPGFGTLDGSPEAV